MKIIVLFIIIFLGSHIHGQPLVKVEVSSDTIAVGEVVEVTYTIENAEGNFNMPDLKGLLIVSGPNSSSSFMYQNGKMSSYQSYSFSLLAREDGLMVIPKTTYVVDDESINIEPVTIVVGKGTSKTSPGKIPVETPSSRSTREKRKF